MTEEVPHYEQDDQQFEGQGEDEQDRISKIEHLRDLASHTLLEKGVHTILKKRSKNHVLNLYIFNTIFWANLYQQIILIIAYYYAFLIIIVRCFH